MSESVLVTLAIDAVFLLLALGGLLWRTAKADARLSTLELEFSRLRARYENHEMAGNELKQDIAEMKTDIKHLLMRG